LSVPKMTVDREAESRSVRRARSLRRMSTDAERSLWSVLRNRRLAGLKFRRQHPIGPYIADFYCEQKRLVVEVDGGQHTPERDDDRTVWLARHGIRVIRFWNIDVLRNRDGVVAMILQELGEDPG